MDSQEGYEGPTRSKLLQKVSYGLDQTGEVIGDTRQHQGVEAGKPFEQLLQVGCKPPSLTGSCARKVPNY